jgi:hypothetical protein
LILNLEAVKILILKLNQFIGLANILLLNLHFTPFTALMLTGHPHFVIGLDSTWPMHIMPRIIVSCAATL